MTAEEDSEHLVIWFWHLILSPHMSALATELAHRGHDVVCVVGEEMTSDRLAQGWSTPDLGTVSIRLIGDKKSACLLAHNAPTNSVHICQGLRANGYIRFAQRVLERRQLRHYVIMETVDDKGIKGILKRAAYKTLFFLKKRRLAGILTIGHRTAEWVRKQGVAARKIYPFAYFLADVDVLPKSTSLDKDESKFHFIYVGQLIGRKRVDLLIEALAEIKKDQFELTVVGVGNQDSFLRALADQILPGRVTWLGRISMKDVPSVIQRADCLVLASEHDGWGAVCSEALMVGTPVVCSDACGAAGVVHASRSGGVFESGNREQLRDMLKIRLSSGPISKRQRDFLSVWAQSLGASAGADYLTKIICNPSTAVPPWYERSNT